MSQIQKMAFFCSGYGSRLSALNGYFKHILYEVCLNAPESAKFALTAMGLSPTLAPVPTASGRQYGEVSEWLKEHAWKVCIRQRIEGSNPSLTAIFKERACTQVRAFLRLYRASPGRDENPRPGFDHWRSQWDSLQASRADCPKGEARRAESIPPSPPYSKREPVLQYGLFCVYIAPAQGGMRSLDQGSTTGAASGTVCEPREQTARRVRPDGPNQSLHHRHIQRKSLS